MSDQRFFPGALVPAPEEHQSPGTFVQGHGQPNAGQSPQQVDAEEPAAQYGKGPHEDDADGNGGLYVPGSIQGHNHAHIHGPANFQEDVDEKNHLPQGVDFWIIGKDGENQVAVEVDQNRQGARKQHGNEDGEFYPLVHFPVVVRPFKVADQNLGGHSQGLGVQVADHGNDVGIYLGSDYRNAKQIHKGHQGRLGQLVGEGFSCRGNSQIQELGQFLFGERPQMGKGQADGGLFPAQVQHQHKAQGFGRIGGNAYSQDAQGRNGAQPVNQHHIAADVQDVHDGGAEHSFPQQGKAPEKRDKGGVGALDNDKKPNPAQIQGGIRVNFQGYPQKLQEKAGKQEKNQAD